MEWSHSTDKERKREENPKLTRFVELEAIGGDQKETRCVCVHCKQLYWWRMKIKLCVQRQWRRPLLFSMEIFPFCGFCVSLFHLTATVAVVLVVTSSHLQVEFIFLFSSFVLGRGFPEREKPIWSQFINRIFSDKNFATQIYTTHLLYLHTNYKTLFYFPS